MFGYIKRICTSFIDVPDKISVAIYFSGCSIRCPDCQNKELWDKKIGIKTDIETVFLKIKSNKLADYVVFLGGEPTDQIDFLKELTEKIKTDLKKPIALYTGREFEILDKDLLKNLNMVVCGPYKKELGIKGWPASSNQRVFRKENEQWIC